MSPPVYPNPLGPLDILTANYVNSMVAAITTSESDITLMWTKVVALMGATAGRIFTTPRYVVSVSTGVPGEYEVTLSHDLQFYQPDYGVVSVSAGTSTFSGFSSDGFRYIYSDAADSGNLTASSTAPDVTGLWMNGSDTKRYICSAVRVGGAILRLTKSNGRAVFGKTTSTKVTSTGSANRTVDLTPYLPLAGVGPGYERSENVVCYGTVDRSSPSAHARTVYVGGSDADTSDVFYEFAASVGGFGTLGEFHVRDTAALSAYPIYDAIGAGSGDTTVSLHVRSFCDPWNP